MAGHFTHYAVTGYARVCATCTLSASATVQVAHTLAHPLNRYKKIIRIELWFNDKIVDGNWIKLEMKKKKVSIITKICRFLQNCWIEKWKMLE